ncbi:PREDICTED: uncharacterized protein LOC104814691 [Tarenaya hassleriana]|uniref:uncharacterized protein LOC104814691 n=1 Tax=Tarenaya hassleriana TaxID=28532 RepID=UPI00053C4CA2|nr:PREDICTED: uncharacterized protein LOC104814691 [Tarenaya hassleriana]
MKKSSSMEKLNTKWVASTASIWIQCFTGATYTFGIYSSVLKSSQSYDQSTLDTVSIFKDIGGTFGLLSGLLYTAVTSGGGRGPWLGIFVGLIQWFSGFFFMWASVVGLIDRPPVPLMCLFVFLSGHSLPFFNTANVVTAVRNFSDYGGTAVGIMQGFLGLSGAVLVQLYHIFSEGNPATYILLLAVVPTLVILSTMPFVRIYDSITTGDKKHLDGLSMISLIIVSYLMVIITLENLLGLSRPMQICSFVVLILMLCLPLLVAVRARREEKQRLLSLDCPVVPDRTALLHCPKPDISPETDLIEEDDDLNILQAMCKLNFWLLFLAMISGMGSGFATINNIRQVGESLHYPTVQLNSLVSLWSIWNFLGRFGAGYISDTYLHKYGWPRPVFMAVTLAIMAIGHIVMASGVQGSLYIGSLLIGMAYGSQWSLMPTITSEIFGIKHMGTIYFTISIAGPVGSYICSVKVIGYFYDKVASGDDNSCFGNHCFMTSFMIMSALALFGSLVACVLFLRTRRFYSKLVARRIVNFVLSWTVKITDACASHNPSVFIFVGEVEKDEEQEEEKRASMEKLNTKWVASTASIWIQCFIGATYTFGIYSSILKSSQSYDQSTLDTVSIFKDVGGTFGILSGLLYTAVTSGDGGGRRPWLVIFAGLIQWFSGFFFVWASVVGLIDRPPVPLMCFFVFLCGHSLPFFNTANVVTAIRNFPGHGGTAVGIMVGFFGLSGAILVQLYHIFCDGNPAAYILLLAVVPTLVISSTMPFVRIYDLITSGDKKHLDWFSVISLIIVAYLTVVIVLENFLGLSRSMRICCFVVLLLMLCLPLLVAVRAHREEKQRLLSLDCPVVPDRTSLLDCPKPNVSSETDLIEEDDDDLNILQAMCKLNFWLLFLAMLPGMGSGFATINNIRQVGESLHYSTVQLNSLVSLWSIWNFLGRFGSGYISDTCIRKYGWPRPVFMAVTLALMAIGHVVMASGFQGNLYIGSLLIGMAFGSQWSLMPTITSEIFGIKHMATIYHTIAAAGPIGSYVCSVKVIGYFYDKVASVGDNSCFGNHCFMTSFMIMSALALFGSLVACILFFRTRRFYSKHVARRIVNQP